jgi:hypothetical protein
VKEIRKIILAVAFAVLPARLAAGEPPQQADGEFRKGKGTLGCAVRAAPGMDPRKLATLGYMPCLRVGAIAIGASADQVEAVLGAPFNKKADEKGSETRYYSLEPGNPPPSYFIVAYENSKVAAVQVTGVQPKPGFAFSTVQVGDDASKIISVLGNPSQQVCERELKMEIWAYTPFPFSFGIRNHKIVLFKVTAPFGSNAPFVPLKSIAESAC